LSKLSVYEKGFVEGLFDGEGCLCLVHTKERERGKVFRIEMSVSNTNLELIKKIQKMIGGNIQKSIRTNRKHNDCYLLKISPNSMREILPQIHLVVKEHKRKIALKVLKIMRQRTKFSRWNKEYKIKELFDLYRRFYNE